MWISDTPAGRLLVCGKHFNVAIFSDTMNINNVKLCMHVLPIHITLNDLAVFQDHSSVTDLTEGKKKNRMRLS